MHVRNPSVEAKIARKAKTITLFVFTDNIMYLRLNLIGIE
jgi:hypothetical protein